MKRALKKAIAADTAFLIVHRASLGAACVMEKQMVMVFNSISYNHANSTLLVHDPVLPSTKTLPVPTYFSVPIPVAEQNYSSPSVPQITPDLTLDPSQFPGKYREIM